MVEDIHMRNGAKRRKILKTIGSGVGAGSLLVGTGTATASNCTLSEDSVDGYFLTVHGEGWVHESCDSDYEFYLFKDNHSKNTRAKLEESTNDYARIRNPDSMGGEMKGLGGSLPSSEYDQFEFNYDGNRNPFSKLETQQDLTAYFRDKDYDDWHWEVEFHGCGTVHMRFSNPDKEPDPREKTEEYFVETGTTNTYSYLTVNVEHGTDLGGDEAYPGAWVSGDVKRIEVTDVGDRGSCDDATNILQIATKEY